MPFYGARLGVLAKEAGELLLRFFDPLEGLGFVPGIHIEGQLGLLYWSQRACHRRKLSKL